MKGSGTIATEVRDVTGFDEVELRGTGILTLEQGEREGIEIQADDNLLPEITTEVKDRRLVISTRSRILSLFRPSQPIRYRVWLRDLRKAVLSGSGEINADRLVTEDLTLGISGSGRLRVDALTAVSLDASISGSGEGTLAGAVDRLSIEVSGSGDLHVERLPCRTARVNVGGSGNCWLTVSDELDVRVSGSGRIRYAGSPRVSQRISGSGRVTPME